MVKLRHRLAGLAAAGILSLAMPSKTDAAESAPVQSSHVTATLVTDVDAIQPGVTFQAGLRLRLAPGWHTYWKNPGDAGVAPEFALQLPPGSVVGPAVWPAPERVAEADLTTFAYRGEVVLPVAVTPGQTPLTLKAHASWLVCHDICVPEEGEFTLALPAGASTPSAQAPLFAAMATRTPVRAQLHASFDPQGLLSVSGPDLPTDVTTAEFFPTGEGQTETKGAQAPVRHAGRLTFPIALSSSHVPNSNVAGVLTLRQRSGATHSFELVATPSLISAGPQPQSFLPLLLASLAGGLLLNLMPCVFPILAMKALALARLPGASRRAIRMQAASYAAGVVLAFVSLGAILLSLRSAGEAVGWGFQLQSPQFVTAMAWVLFGAGLNMSGVFVVGRGMAGAGQSLAEGRGHLGSFFTGVLAVVVAAPCTTAFMGAALAGALAAPAAVAVAVFAVMGLGLALPYMAVAAVPQLAMRLPRPGRWMVLLQQALAFPMYGAAAWLVWVVSQQIGSTGVLTAGAGLICVGFAAWTFGVAQFSTSRGRYVGYAGTLVGGLSLLALLVIPASGVALPSEPFSPARLAELQSEGRPVFVNMTAAWCLSCLVNERLALSQAGVAAAFNRDHIAYLKGDWTRRDPAISTLLHDHDREGVPLYIFYAPGKPPVILPQILSQGAILQQVAKLPG